MFSKSAADVFRTRQAVRDLKGVILSTTDYTIHRVAAGLPATFAVNVDRAVALRDWLDSSDCRFSFPEDEPVYTAILLSAALPDDDYPAFTFATAILLCDALQNGDGSDDLYWNWITFQEQYRLADAPVRAALMNGFRALNDEGQVRLGQGPSEADCLSRTRSEVLRIVETDDELADLLSGDLSSETAGARWDAVSALTQGALHVFRYLYERPSSISPKSEDAALLPWRFRQSL